jgi:DNA-binding CsgD family transcriptional regulator
VVGEPGIGKTTLWSRLLSSVDADWRWKARCLEIEADLGLAVLADFFGAVPDEVAALLPGPQRHALDVVLFRVDDSGEGQVGGRLLGATLLGVLAELCGRGTVMLAIDDLQWCDPASFEAFSYALHRIGDAPVAMVATRRSGAGQDFPHSSQIAVPPLNDAEALEVVRSMAGATVSDDIAADIAARCSGNPFFASELARQWAEHPAASRLPGSLRELLERRLTRLDPHARALLVDVAVQGEPSVLEFDERDLRPVLEADILRIEDGRICFAHPLLASAVVETAESGQLVAARRRAAAATTDPVAALMHRAQYERPSEEFAAALDAGVGISLARGDPICARNLADLALAFTPSRRRPPVRLHRLLDLEGATGRYDRAMTIGRELLAVAETSAQRAIALCWSADPHNSDESVVVCQQAIEVPGLPDRYRQVVVGELASALYDVGRMSEAITVLEESLRTATDPQSWPDSVGSLAHLKRHAGIPDDGVLLRDVIEHGLAAEGVAGVSAPPVHNAIGAAGCIAVLDDRHDEAARLLAEAERIASRWGEVNESVYFGAALACRTGRLERAATELQEMVTRYGDATAHGQARLALIHAWRGDTAQATAWIDTARTAAGSLDGRAWSEINFASGFLSLLSGNATDAWHPLREAAAQLDRIGYREPSHPAVLPAAIEAAVAVGEMDEADTLCNRLERESAALGSRFGFAAARRSRGFIADVRGDLDEAGRCFADAADAFTSLGVPLEAGRAFMALGALLRRRGQRRRAREALSSARTIFTDSGAHGLIRGCDAELGRISGRLASTSAQLTESERQVAELVATGLRNVDVARTLHVSVKTVETHLGHTYRKLGVTNRTELAAHLADHRSTNGPRAHRRMPGAGR